MAKVTIDGTAYDTAEMPEETLRILASLNATDKQIRELSDQLAISRTARNAYASQLKDALAVKA